MNGVTSIGKIPAQYQTIKALPKSSGFKEIYAEALQRHGCGIATILYASYSVHIRGN